MKSCEKVMDNATVNIGQSIVASRVPEGQTFVVDSHLMENGCVQVMHMHPIVDGVHAKVIG